MKPVGQAPALVDFGKKPHRVSDSTPPAPRLSAPPLIDLGKKARRDRAVAPPASAGLPPPALMDLGKLPPHRSEARPASPALAPSRPLLDLGALPRRDASRSAARGSRSGWFIALLVLAPVAGFVAMVLAFQLASRPAEPAPVLPTQDLADAQSSPTLFHGPQVTPPWREEALRQFATLPNATASGAGAAGTGAGPSPAPASASAGSTTP